MLGHKKFSTHQGDEESCQRQGWAERKPQVWQRVFEVLFGFVKLLAGEARRKEGHGQRQAKDTDVEGLPLERPGVVQNLSTSRTVNMSRLPCRDRHEPEGKPRGRQGGTNHVNQRDGQKYSSGEGVSQSEADQAPLKGKRRQRAQDPTSKRGTEANQLLCDQRVSRVSDHERHGAAWSARWRGWVGASGWVLRRDGPGVDRW